MKRRNFLKMLGLASVAAAATKAIAHPIAHCDSIEIDNETCEPLAPPGQVYRWTNPEKVLERVNEGYVPVVCLPDGSCRLSDPDNYIEGSKPLFKGEQQLLGRVAG